MDDDDDSKVKATPKGPAVKPGAFSEGGNVESNTDQESNITTTIDPPESMCRVELDILAKQKGNSSNDVRMKPGAVSVGGHENNQSTRIESVPGATQEAPSSRLAAKLRGELPENWNESAKAVSTLESREAKLQSKIRESEPPVNSKLVDREDQIQSKMRESETSVNSTLMNREDQIQGKIRAADNSTPASMPGALASLSDLEDAVTTKQGAGRDLLSMDASPPKQLQQREDLAAAKNNQVSHNMDDAPQRLQQVEAMLDIKMRDGTADNVNRTTKTAGNETMEYGEYGGSNDADLAVAFAVDEEEGADLYLPAAVEYDPDAKPPLYRSNRFRLYTCLAMIAVVIGIIGAVLGIVLTIDEDDEQPPKIQYRETLGIRENIELFVGTDGKLDDSSSPYHKALNWIMFVDPLALTPESPRLAQRYVAAYFYYATSAKKPWTSGCNPPQDGESEFCVYRHIQENSQETTLKRMRWLSNVDECEWAGIFCDDLFHIREFDISMAIFIVIYCYILFAWLLTFLFCNIQFFFLEGGTELTGTFPEGVMLLPFIQSLRLAHSELEGSLPDYLPDAKHLITISFENNTFTGTFPDRWLESRSFQRVLLFDNNITGIITPNITQLKDMKVYVLNGNRLEGTIPSEFGEMLNLVEIEVEQNLLTGSIPTEIGRLTGIEHLHFGRNNLTGTIPSEIGSMGKLFTVRLHVNSLVGTVPEQFWNSEKLFQVDISENNLSGMISGAFGRLTDLVEISLNNNQFSGSLPSRIASGSTAFSKIVASGNNFTGTVASEICARRLSSAVFKTLQLDCKIPVGGGLPEISCEEGCCTQCCDSNGSNCIEV